VSEDPRIQFPTPGDALALRDQLTRVYRSVYAEPPYLEDESAVVRPTVSNSSTSPSTRAIAGMASATR
jgi:hypothetical protein